jgi:hypothetical protein
LQADGLIEDLDFCPNTLKLVCFVSNLKNKSHELQIFEFEDNIRKEVTTLQMTPKATSNPQ